MILLIRGMSHFLHVVYLCRHNFLEKTLSSLEQNYYYYLHIKIRIINKSELSNIDNLDLYTSSYVHCNQILQRVLFTFCDEKI